MKSVIIKDRSIIGNIIEEERVIAEKIVRIKIVSIIMRIIGVPKTHINSITS